MSKTPPKTEGADSGADAAAAAANPTPEAAQALPVEVRVLQACVYGAANQVTHVPAGELAAAKADGLVDDAAEAVAYARSLAQPAA